MFSCVGLQSHCSSKMKTNEYIIISSTYLINALCYWYLLYLTSFILLSFNDWLSSFKFYRFSFQSVFFMILFLIFVAVLGLICEVFFWSLLHMLVLLLSVFMLFPWGSNVCVFYMCVCFICVCVHSLCIRRVCRATAALCLLSHVNLSSKALRRRAAPSPLF